MDVWAIVINGAISLTTSGVLGYFTYYIEQYEDHFL